MFGHRPNISGSFTPLGWIGWVEATEAFAKSSETPDNYCPANDQYGGVGITFSATKSNALYGASQTVQPSSVLAIACIKT